MGVFDIAFKQRLSNVAVLQTFVSTDVQVGDSITVAGLGGGFDGTQTIISVEPYLLVQVGEQGDLWFDYSDIQPYQLIFKDAGADVERTSVSAGTITFTQSCSWVDPGDVLNWLGVDPANAADVQFLGECTNAANAFSFRKRRESGYNDSLSTVPGDDVKHGTVLYAAMLYRERGAIDGFASFDGFGTGGAPTLSIGRVMQLLGCGKPQVG